MVIVQTVVRALESAPPPTKTPAGLQGRTIGSQNETVYAIIRAIKKVCVVFGKVIPWYHGILQAIKAWEMSYSIGRLFFNPLWGSKELGSWTLRIGHWTLTAPQEPLFPREVAEKA